MRGLAVGALLLCMAAQQSWAWGHEGHRLTALVAEQYLTPETKAQVAMLLRKQTLADIASWLTNTARTTGRQRSGTT
jgi:hypothetical protein